LPDKARVKVYLESCLDLRLPLKVLRTSEIAREVGVHPNTVRLYEEWGYLPQIPRSASGYRQFNTLHLQQMKLARLAFADPFPGRHLRRSLANLVRLAAEGKYSDSLAAAFTHKAFVKREITQTEDAADYLQRWASGELKVEEKMPLLLAGQTAELLQVTKDTLRHWERNGLFEAPRDPQNGYRLYGPQEIGQLRVLRMLTRAGYSTMSVLRTFRSLEQGYQGNLREILDTPSADEDIFYIADRWLTTLREHEERSQQIINHLQRTISLVTASIAL
jgi:DNA-binding transcriptional MerR regulator